MDLFNWLLVGHLTGDFILQTRWMAEKKTQEFLPLLVHSAVYTAVVSAFGLIAGGLSWRGIGLVFISHILLDQRKFIELWARIVNGNLTIDWLKTVLDQSWHILILALAILI